jgi:hypothetical protein
VKWAVHGKGGAQLGATIYWLEKSQAFEFTYSSSREKTIIAGR